MARDFTPLTESGLPKRARNALRYGGINTLEEAAEWSDRELLSLPNIGPAYVASLRALIKAAQYGVSANHSL